MDIDDILADIDGGSGGSLATEDLQALTRAWVNEKGSPEILTYPSELIERVMDRIRKQIETIEMQTGDMDPKMNFRLVILQTELERFKYLIRSFLRVRLAKIDKHALHILTNSEVKARLSASEIQYLTAHQALLHSHYRASFLAQFPPNLQRLDDTAGGISMVEHPDLDQVIFCRVLHDVADPITIEGTDTADVWLKRGDIFVVRWRHVADAVTKGEVELI
ncbi:GINS complex, Sld5 component [Xylona heveae TC161]|uniref:DNA replication complex GINS protein SLD5 n=1 Tax=Xylona heveae (strain CBS 132557 / TC161) TaxID=1328760 RepID=A0A165GPB4_XYLHT|nr:GINS complex, Sld5 component [Xylona heveae TC161]KZF22430.1 GINS complex, Sld5 component [Xylona heveae TC161]